MGLTSSKSSVIKICESMTSDGEEAIRIVKRISTVEMKYIIFYGLYWVVQNHEG